MASLVTETYGYDKRIEQRIIRQLALEWIQSHLPNDELTFVDCLDVLNQLQTATQNSRQTETIFEIVFDQAHQLNKSSEWLGQELQFEALALIDGNRESFVHCCLNQSQSVDDSVLDVYLDRQSRRMDG